MVSKQQDIPSEIGTCECSTGNSFGFAEKLLRYTEQEEVFSHWTLTNIHSKKEKKLSLLLFTSLLEIGERKQNMQMHMAQVWRQKDLKN